MTQNLTSLPQKLLLILHIRTPLNAQCPNVVQSSNRLPPSAAQTMKNAKSKSMTCNQQTTLKIEK